MRLRFHQKAAKDLLQIAYWRPIDYKSRSLPRVLDKMIRRESAERFKLQTRQRKRHIKPKNQWRVRSSRHQYRQFQTQKREIVGQIVRQAIRERIQRRILSSESTKYHKIRAIDNNDAIRSRTERQLEVASPDLYRHAKDLGIFSKVDPSQTSQPLDRFSTAQIGLHSTQTSEDRFLKSFIDSLPLMKEPRPHIDNIEQLISGYDRFGLNSLSVENSSSKSIDHLPPKLQDQWMNPSNHQLPFMHDKKNSDTLRASTALDSALYQSKKLSF